ncbi:hypothetical protein FOZ63_010253, partial [Perkinsus olseni]
MIKDCASSPTGEVNNNTIWSYIPSTGQLINGRSCLTAKPAYPYSTLTSSWNTHGDHGDHDDAVDAWQAWHVVSDVCSNTVNKESRQSWDIITTGHLDNGAGGGGHQHLVAAVCGDVTLPSQQWSLWKTITILDNGNSWAACEDAACSQCINEGEIRYNNAHPPPAAAAAYHQDYHY